MDFRLERIPGESAAAASGSKTSDRNWPLVDVSSLTGTRRPEKPLRSCAQLLGTAAIMFAAAIGGCASDPSRNDGPVAPLVFPPAPEEPRFVHEMTLVGSTQVIVDTKKARWRALLTGETQRGEGLSKPFDVTVCRGVVYVSDTVQRRVLVFDFPRHRFFRIGDDEPGALLKPLGLATDAQCTLYVADGSLHRVMIYDAEGKYRTSVGGVDAFHHLSHVAADPLGSRIYAVDTGGVGNRDHRVRVYDPVQGDHLFDIGVRGTGPGEFNLPKDIAVAPNGNLYVVDSANFRVQIFSAQGEFLGAFGSMGAQFGQFTRPKGIALDASGNVYVSDAAFGNFQIFNAQGQLLMFIGSRSNTAGPAKYMLPAGIDVDADGRIYFVDQFFRKVDIYRPAGLEAEAGHLGRSKTQAMEQ